MKFYLTVAISLFGAAAANAQAPTYGGPWYYCEPAGAYYPYLQSCPVPWREIAAPASHQAEAAAQPRKTASPPGTTSKVDAIAQWSGTGDVRLGAIHADAPWELRWISSGDITIELHSPVGARCADCLRLEVAGEPGIIALRGSPAGSDTWQLSHTGEFFLVVKSSGSWSIAAHRSQPASGSSDHAISIDAPAAPDETTGQFRSELVGIAKILRGARTAGYCGLRSEQWFATIKTGLTIGIDGDEDRLRARSSNVPAFDAYTKAIRDWAGKYSLPPVPGEEECRRLINSPEIERLDGIERKITGNYH